MTIDETTGLPELPEGKVWRIKSYSRPYVRVEIISEPTLFLPTKVYGWHPIRKENVSPATIQRAAGYALREANEDINTETDWRDYLGVYPPKKLEKTL